MVLHVLLPVDSDSILLRLPGVTAAAEGDGSLLTRHAASGLSRSRAPPVLHRPSFPRDRPLLHSKSRRRSHLHYLRREMGVA
jgi:hypothetical protein